MVTSLFDKQQIPDDVGISEAPSDGSTYGRKDASWKKVDDLNSIEMANFIVESSTNRDPSLGWVWDKYADGTFSAIQIKTDNIAAATSWANGFISADIAYPALPFSTVSVDYHAENRDGSFITVRNMRASQTYSYFSGISRTAANWTVTITARGRYSASATAPIPTNVAYKPDLTFHNPNAFVYTTTKQDTGRTTDDGQVIWGQKFVGTITAALNTEVLTTVDSTFAISNKFLLVKGWFESIDGSSAKMYIPTANSGALYTAAVDNLSGLRLFTKSQNPRTNKPFCLEVDFTDGTLRSSHNPNALPHFKPNVIFQLTAVPVTVGSVWVTGDARDPHLLWPGTAWQLLPDGYLLMSGNASNVGTTGGSDVLATTQIPSHTHVGANIVGSSSSSFSPWAAMPLSPGSGLGCGYGTHYGNATGGGQPHQHPYRKMYMWLRLPDVGPVSEFDLAEISELITQYKPPDLTAGEYIADYKFKGKTVYGKVVDTGALASVSKYVNHNVTGIVDVVKQWGMAWSGAGGGWYTLPRVSSSSFNSTCEIFTNALQINLIMGTSCNFASSWVCIEYTKT